MYNVILKCVRTTIVAVEKLSNITQPVCAVVALGISMQCECAILQHFSTLSHKHQHFFKKKLLNLKCLFELLYNLCPKYFHSKKN